MTHDRVLLRVRARDQIPKRGVLAYMNQLVEPYVGDVNTQRTSAWVHAGAAGGAADFQLGWYKGQAFPAGNCGTTSSMRIYAEKASTQNPYTCVQYQGGTPGVNIRYPYQIFWNTINPDGTYIWYAYWNGNQVTTLTIPFSELY